MSAHSTQHNHAVTRRKRALPFRASGCSRAVSPPPRRNSVLQEHAVCSGTLLRAPTGVTAATPRCPPGPGLWLLLESGRSSGSAALSWREPVAKGGEEKAVSGQAQGFQPSSLRFLRMGLTEARPVLLLLECPGRLSARAGKLLGLQETDLKMPQALTQRAELRGHLVREEGRRGPSLRSLWKMGASCRSAHAQGPGQRREGDH